MKISHNCDEHDSKTGLAVDNRSQSSNSAFYANHLLNLALRLGCRGLRANKLVLQIGNQFVSRLMGRSEHD